MTAGLQIRFSLPIGLTGLTANQEYQLSPLRVPTHILVEWSLRESFLVPREIHIWPV